MSDGLIILRVGSGCYLERRPVDGVWWHTGSLKFATPIPRSEAAAVIAQFPEEDVQIVPYSGSLEQKIRAILTGHRMS